MANEITADPAQLRKFAENISRCHSIYRSNLANSKSQVDSLKGVWTGEAATAFVASFQMLYNKCEEGLQTLARMIDALYQSADSYERNEKAIKNEAAKLPKLPTNTLR
ncbi:MAG: WXG100 family type VII secretion target [Deltaproteobacteria bacterium]|jgi:WXG100 family type VII secretion target|nr:WXG100 family type VII secretion target [Deltaproteobacteria bacterium]